ncbi:MAG: hypothetical protein EZS28_019899 [Streblomastix strix]|uniref:Uncharacterized protein n=1 Tax=Streblomastix strix TaxID=222440 RepID=A0A5J4VPP8_9EUKA|nr:MAG: hypothetical protein EZS28_019899 [Streblomastix strix]
MIRCLYRHIGLNDMKAAALKPEYFGEIQYSKYKRCAYLINENINQKKAKDADNKPITHNIVNLTEVDEEEA